MSQALQHKSHDFRAENLTISYGDRPVLEGLSLKIPDRLITSIIGPNGCGKSTLLAALARLLKPREGSVLLDGQPLAAINSRRLAQLVGLLPQSPIAPEGITVADLVGRGRSPHQGLFGRWTKRDYDVVDTAMEITNVSQLADHSVDELSGGQRQRVWIAMALAQETDIVLLDEPTTYLDVTTQLDILELVHELNRARQVTVVMVLHDMNLAARFSDHIVAMRDGCIKKMGTPEEVFTSEVLREVFELEAKVIEDPLSCRPLVIPKSRAHL